MFLNCSSAFFGAGEGEPACAFTPRTTPPLTIRPTIMPATAIRFAFIRFSPRLEFKQSSKCSPLIGQRFRYVSQAIDHPRHPLEIHLIGRIECGVVVRIAKGSRVRDHDSRPVFLPERPMIRP